MTATDKNGSFATDSSHSGASDPRVTLLPQGNHLLSLMTILRDSNTDVANFAEVTERVGDQLISAGVYLDVVTSETDTRFTSVRGHESSVLILEPMLATGGSACVAIDTIKANGVAEENIVFVNILASQRGIRILLDRFPSIRLVTAAIDNELTPSNHISPGLGDFGDRFYGTH
ncbi:hypothetical protein N7466_000071 [Penicillium verhagenii]|uniref:uncharacterized protein n=1 Tax=Penicillium verhagenii TaxID=1562060 RepID=UPI002545925A|nr:uncharacterized protein N7466_000071 [Penicillium verhagenii]KAJ5947056.1 hypothetical protein N7466_000071 [Penicillium verhagenii]